MAAIQALQENVPRLHIEHAAPVFIDNGRDLSAKKAPWQSYFWDTWDKSPEVSIDDI